MYVHCTYPFLSQELYDQFLRADKDIILRIVMSTFGEHRAISLLNVYYNLLLSAGDLLYELEPMG